MNKQKETCFQKMMQKQLKSLLKKMETKNVRVKELLMHQFEGLAFGAPVFAAIVNDLDARIRKLEQKSPSIAPMSIHNTPHSRYATPRPLSSTRVFEC